MFATTSHSRLWPELRDKAYREAFVEAQVKQSIPFQIRSLLKFHELTQEGLADRGAGLTQGVVSRAANPNYGNLTLNTIIRVAAAFDVAFIGQFVPFSELDRWYQTLSEEKFDLPTFVEEDEQGDEGDPGAPESTGSLAKLYALRPHPARLQTTAATGDVPVATGPSTEVVWLTGKSNT